MFGWRWGVTLVVVLGVSLGFWTLIGLLRKASEYAGRRRPPAAGPDRPLHPGDVAVLIPARNEALVIAATIRSVLRLVPPASVHVIADGCDDDTAPIARSYGVNVLERNPAGGKAAGIEAAVAHFDLPGRFEVLLLVDADTELDRDYLVRGLPLFDDPGVVAVAGYARTAWRPDQLRWIGRLLVAYRTRLYAVMQWLKYGQTWRWTNLTAIVPGFASMYRTRVLPHIDLNPPGLVIEDFNMTFELHHKRLGRIAFHPGVCGTTQDPDNLHDYVRQITRWQLGLWQTVRRHGVWRSWFWVALGAFLLEVIVASASLLLLAALLVAVPAVDLGHALVGWPWLTAAQQRLAGMATPAGVGLYVVLPDFLLTCASAILMRRPSLPLYGLAFLPIRMLDAVIMLWTLPQAWFTTSNGRWTSPGRRAAGAPAALKAPAPIPTPAAHPQAHPAAVPATILVPTPRAPIEVPVGNAGAGPWASRRLRRGSPPDAPVRVAIDFEQTVPRLVPPRPAGPPPGYAGWKTGWPPEPRQPDREPAEAVPARR